MILSARGLWQKNLVYKVKFVTALWRKKVQKLYALYNQNNQCEVLLTTWRCADAALAPKPMEPMSTPPTAVLPVCVVIVSLVIVSIIPDPSVSIRWNTYSDNFGMPVRGRNFLWTLLRSTTYLSRLYKTSWCTEVFEGLGLPKNVLLLLLLT